MDKFLTTAFVTTVGLLVPAVEGCSLYCAKDEHPVCAHSPIHRYKTFSDKCALEQANHCGDGDWTLIRPGPCITTEIAGGCPLFFGAVCGRSPTYGFKTFLNKCFFELVAELTDFILAHVGACTPHEVPPSICPGACTQEYAPICGYSPVAGFSTFSNKCYLELENTCFHGSYSPRHTGKCTDKELLSNCKRACTKEYRPVCGLSVEKGFKTFDNLCLFFVHNGCPQFDSDYKLIHDGACTTNEIASFCQPGFCPKIENPVCAANSHMFRTFPNRCHFYVENICKYGNFQLVHAGACTEKENHQSCSAVCSQEAAPVCGFSSNRGFKTFINRCYLNHENACHGSDYGAVSLGECKKDQLGLICGDEFCPKQPVVLVCGHSPSKGYTTFKSLCFLYANNICKFGDYKPAHFGECTKKELGLICLPEFCLQYQPSIPVCGFSKITGGHFTFSNQCFLNAENICKGQDFVLKHKDKCSPLEERGQCPVLCTQELQYICGHSPTFGFKTFNNKCAFEVENGCNSGDFGFAHPGECTKLELEKNCQKVCTLEYKPVCAVSPTKGPHTFPNECAYILDVSCYGSDYKLKHGGVCSAHDVPPPPPVCHPTATVCPAIYNPVCAYSKSKRIFHTFSSKCFLDADNKCKYNNDFIFAHPGECSPLELDNKCHRLCPLEILPVCGRSPTLLYKNFKNTCELLLAHSCFGSDYLFVHDGKCTPNEAPTCATLCPHISNPICGFSPSKKAFKTIPNKCLLERENQCDFGDFVIAHGGECTKYELENNCKRECVLIDSPVCGYSFTKGHKTFGNICSFIFHITCQGGDFVFLSEGRCKYPEGPQKDCPAICPKDNVPVCTFSSNAKSFRTFLNQCLWAAENRCKHGDYVFVHHGMCTENETGKKCNHKCAIVYEPVCGVHVLNGFRTFPSLCELEMANKCHGADYSLAHLKKCTPEELGGSCNHFCYLYYTGICGWSHIKGFKTFPNECFLDRENTCSLSDYRKQHDGKCTPEETGGECNRICQLVHSPICGRSPSKGYKTFGNFCLMDRDNSCLYHDYNVIHQGECLPWELCVNCKP